MAERCFGQQLLETDGCNPAFFYLLAKENKRSLKSCEMHIPLTILFEQGYVKALFTTEQGGERDQQTSSSSAASPSTDILSNETPGEIKRKSGKDVDLLEVYDSLVAGSKEGDIVAELLFAKTPTGEMNGVQFLDAKMLHRFLFVDVDKPKSLLQKFIRPKGNNNFKILATWSPLMMMAEGKRCPNSLTSRHLPVSIRGATFEDPTINAVDVVVNRTVVRGINEICCEMAAHFERTEKLSLTRFGAFFKVDENNKLFLMYPTSIRMHECGAVDKVTAPVSLSSKVEIAKNDVATRPKDAISKQAIDTMDELLREHDQKMSRGNMIINIPSLEDNYTLIRNALHGTRLHGSAHYNTSSNIGQSAKGAHGTSSMYLDGPLPGGMIGAASTQRAASSMGGMMNNSAPLQHRRAQSAMGMSEYENNNPMMMVYEKGVGAHSNTNYANPKKAATSTRKTFYSTNLAGTMGSNPHSSDPAMFVNAANTSATAAANGSGNGAGINNSNYQYQHQPSGINSYHARQANNNNGGGHSSSSSLPPPLALNSKRQRSIESRGGKIVPIAADTQLPQPKALLKYQHALPNSQTNMSYATATNNGGGNANGDVIGHSSLLSQNGGGGGPQSPATLRQLNRRTERQIQSDWQGFIDQAQNDLKHWEMREQQSAMRAARLGGGGSPLGGGGSPTLNASHQRVAALEALQQQHLSGGGTNNTSAGVLAADYDLANPSSMAGGLFATQPSPSKLNPPPVKAHSTYDPMRPTKALHIVHDSPFANNSSNSNKKDDPTAQQQIGSTNKGVGFESDKASYMDLVSRRVGTPSAGAAKPSSASAANMNDRANNASATAAPTDYEADARLFISTIQREYQQQNHMHHLSAASLQRPGTGSGGGGVATATVADAQNALSNVSKSVLLPAVFAANSPSRGGGNSPNNNRMSLRPLSQQQTSRANTADREPSGLGGGGFGMGSSPLRRNSPPQQGRLRPLSSKKQQQQTNNSNNNTVVSADAPNVSAIPSASSAAPNPSAPSSSSLGAGYNYTSGVTRTSAAAIGGGSHAFLQDLETARNEAERRAIDTRKTEIAILLQNLPPADRETLEEECVAMVGDFKQYLTELTYALYDLFLMRREGNKVHRFAYVEVPEKFQGFISVGVLNKMLWKLHGKVQPALKFLCDSMPQNDPNYGDISEWRAHLLGGLQVGSLGRNWPCRGNFRSIGAYLDYCTTPLVGSMLQGISSSGGSGEKAAAEDGACNAPNLACDAILLDEFRATLLGFAAANQGGDSAEGIAANDEQTNDDEGKASSPMLPKKRNSNSSNHDDGGEDADGSGVANSPSRREANAVKAMIPISAVRRQSILSRNADGSSNPSFTPIGRSSTAAANTNSKSANTAAGAAAMLASALLQDTKLNKPFAVPNLIKKHREEQRRHKMDLVSQKMANEVHVKRRLQQEARAAGMDEAAYLAKNGINPSDDADLDYFDEIEDDEEEEILEDETIRSFNKNMCLVVPLLDSKGLEIVKTEGFIIDKEVAAYFDEVEGSSGINNNGSSSSSSSAAGTLRGIIPLYVKWYLLDRLNEDAHRDERVAQRRQHRKALKRQQEERQKRALQQDEQNAAVASAAAFSNAASRHQRSMFGADHKNGAGGLERKSSSVKFNAATPAAAVAAAVAASIAPQQKAQQQQRQEHAPHINPLDVVCQRCNSCRILCVCDKVFVASGGARLKGM